MIQTCFVQAADRVCTCVYNHMWVLICVIRSWKFTRHADAGEEKTNVLEIGISILYLIWISQKNIKSLSHRYWLLIYVCKMLLESLPGCNRSTLMVGGIRLIQWLCLRWWHHHQDGWLYALQEYWYQSVTPGWDHHETSWNHWFVLPIKTNMENEWKWNRWFQRVIFFSRGPFSGSIFVLGGVYLCYMMLTLWFG